MENRAARRMRAHRAAPICRARSLSGFLIAAIVALALQSLLVQTHIHRWSNTTDAVALATDLGQQDATPEPAPNPGDGRDMADCALCQHGQFGGQYLTPNVALFALPGETKIRVVALRQSVHFPRPTSHDWHGRAPPT